MRPGQTEEDPIGRPLVHASAFKQATGEAVYVDDLPPFVNELYAAFVVSSRAYAEIVSIDESAALKVEGVERFFCARDIAGMMCCLYFERRHGTAVSAATILCAWIQITPWASVTQPTQLSILLFQLVD